LPPTSVICLKDRKNFKEPAAKVCVAIDMESYRHSTEYYLQRAERTQRLARTVIHNELAAILDRLAHEYQAAAQEIEKRKMTQFSHKFGS
jgi:hypothetical protein